MNFMNQYALHETNKFSHSPAYDKKENAINKLDLLKSKFPEVNYCYEYSLHLLVLLLF